MTAQEFVNNQWSIYQETEEYRKVTDEYVARAREVIDGDWGRNKYTFFRLLSSINLLNAAIKQPEYKKQLSYGYIKRSVVKVLRRLMHDDVCSDELHYYYHTADSCLYVKCLGVVFSFHNVPLCEEVRTVSTYEEITFPGIRLQKIAVPLFDFARQQAAAHHDKADTESVSGPS